MYSIPSKVQAFMVDYWRRISHSFYNSVYPSVDTYLNHRGRVVFGRPFNKIAPVFLALLRKMHRMIGTRNLNLKPAACPVLCHPTHCPRRPVVNGLLLLRNLYHSKLTRKSTYDYFTKAFFVTSKDCVSSPAAVWSHLIGYYLDDWLLSQNTQPKIWYESVDQFQYVVFPPPMLGNIFPTPEMVSNDQIQAPIYHVPLHAQSHRTSPRTLFFLKNHDFRVLGP